MGLVRHHSSRNARSGRKREHCQATRLRLAVEPVPRHKTGAESVETGAALMGRAVEPSVREGDRLA